MASTPPENSQPKDLASFQIDDLIVDVGRRSVSRGGVEIALPGLSFDLLLALARAAPNMLSYDQLMAEVWNGVVVNSETITQRVKLVRDALGDDPQNPRYIAGVRGRGYRMISTAAPIAPPARPAEPPTIASPPEIQPVSRKRIGVVALAVMAVVATGFAWWALRTDHSSPTAKRGAISEVIVTEPKSIAVLPFADMSEDKSQEYFADGMAQEIIDLLTEFPQLTVIGRTSSFSFKGRNEDVRIIGEKLGVRNLVEGSVRRSGDRIRVSAQLIDTASGKNLWSNTFDRGFGDVLAVQDEIAIAIARALRLAVDTDEPHERRTLRNAEAYSYYLRGIIITERWEGESARALFEHALTLDPAFAKAQEALALAISDDMSRRLLPPEEGWIKSAAAARKALELNPRSALSHALIGDERASHAYDWRGANEELDRALALRPRDPVTLAICSTLARDLDRIEESRQLQELALAIDPLNPSALWSNAFMHYFDGDLDEAEESLRTILRISPNFLGAHRLLGTIQLQRGKPAAALAEILAEQNHSYDGLAIAYHALGRKAESDAEISQMKALVQAGKASARALAVAHAARNELDEAFAALELGIKRFEGNFPSQVKHDPRYVVFLNDPRYQRLLRMVNHPDAEPDPAE